VIGYKPTYNDFDKSSILANAPSMDTLGILARSVDDVALLRQILLETPTRQVHEADLSGLTFGLLRAPPWETAEAEVQDLTENFMADLASNGARLVDVHLDQEVSRLLELHRLISGCEFRRSIAFERTHHLDQLSRVLREGRLADGHQVDGREYQNAIQEATRLRARLALEFTEIDILVCPSAAGPALATLETTGDAAFNSAWSLAGNPAITLPLFNARGSGLPIGCQFIADFANDDLLLAASKTIMKMVKPN
jgi:Asp-tRNA(Asn)/Glu-tRNA(Gln) amidotransferase A subunit family amidase